jgi:hypothetical protein
MTSLRMSRFVWAFGLLALASGGAVAREPLVLPLTGITIEAPPGGDYTVDAAWSLLEDGYVFEGRDAIVARTSGVERGVTWVSAGWFAPGSCEEVIARAPVEASWAVSRVLLWGRRWTARGGIYRGGDGLDGKPFVSLCLERGAKKQIVMSHFFQGGAPTDRAPMLAAVRKDALLRAIARAVSREQFSPGAPLRDGRVVNRGVIPARHALSMVWVGGALTLPDDGFVWVAGAELGVDVYDRMVPALPELSVSVGRIDTTDGCAAVFELLPGKVPETPTGVPEGWSIGPGTAATDHHTWSLCRAFPWGMLVAGVVDGSSARDLRPVAPLLEAIAAAAQPPSELAKRAGRDEVIAGIVAPPRRAIQPSRWVVQRTP